jgi:DNA-binding CsgD family transcriptional regulator
MTPPHPRARIIVRARDHRLRSLIIERLSAEGDLEVREDDSDPAEDPRAEDADALVDVMEERPSLTRRETEVLELMADGLANKEIASRLGFSLHTAKFHVESLLRKLAASNRAEAVREGIRLGVIDL